MRLLAVRQRLRTSQERKDMWPLVYPHEWWFSLWHKKSQSSLGSGFLLMQIPGAYPGDTLSFCFSGPSGCERRNLLISLSIHLHR